MQLDHSISKAQVPLSQIASFHPLHQMHDESAPSPRLWHWFTRRSHAHSRFAEFVIGFGQNYLLGSQRNPRPFGLILPFLH